MKQILPSYQNQTKIFTGKENYRQMSLTKLDTILIKVPASQIQKHVKSIIHHHQVGVIPGIKVDLTSKNINVTYQ